MFIILKSLTFRMSLKSLQTGAWMICTGYPQYTNTADLFGKMRKFDKTTGHSALFLVFVKLLINISMTAH